jgi:ABC-2 type transport system permease protein
MSNPPDTHTRMDSQSSRSALETETQSARPAGKPDLEARLECSATSRRALGQTVEYRRFSPGRIAAICSNTLTELTRLKVFYLLLLFGLILIAGSVFLARFSFQQEFQILKDVSLGAMSIFSSLLAIVATARLIPQDIEDRTIYSTLAKPVPRYEYLLGRLGGALLLLAITILAMSALFFVVMYTREQAVLGETARQMASMPAAQTDQALQAVRASALNANLLPAIGLIYIKACLLAALTLFVSTFATTNIFTIIVMVLVYFIGHLQGTAREYWLHQHGGGWITRIFLALVALLFPDLQAFNLVDDAVLGNTIPAVMFGKIAALGVFYIIVYTAMASVVFSGKEL